MRNLLFVSFLFAISPFIVQSQSACAYPWPKTCNDVSGMPSFNTLFVGKQVANDAPFRYLDCPEEGEELIAYALSYNFDHLVVYGIRDYLDGYLPANVENLRRFIGDVHAAGLTIAPTVGKYDNASNIRQYLDDANTQQDERYDALCMESEPWKSVPDMSWSTYFSSINSHRLYCNLKSLKFEIYIGNPTTQSQVNKICSAAHRIYVTYYREHPCDNTTYQNLFHFKTSRLKMLAKASTPPEQISILFNAKSTSDDPDMSQWLAEVKAANPNLSFTDILQLPFRRWYACDHGFKDNLPLGTQDSDIDFEIGSSKLTVLGHSWYCYQDLRQLTGPMGENNYCTGLHSELENREHYPGDSTPFEFRYFNEEEELMVYLPSIALKKGKCRYSVYDVFGRELAKGYAADSMQSIRLEGLVNGVYFISVTNKKVGYNSVERFYVLK